MISELTKNEIIKKAFYFHSEGNITQAIKYYQCFVNEGFSDHLVFSNYGGILTDLDKNKEAEIYLRKAIKLKPSFALAHYNLANTLVELEKTEEALIYFKNAIRLKPKFTEAYLNIGNIMRNSGNLKDAEIYTRKAINLSPDFHLAYYNLGNILRDSGNLNEAITHYNKAININPSFVDTYVNLSNIYSDYGELDKAEILLGRANKINPKLLICYLNQGRIFQLQNKIEEAIEAYLKCIKLSNKNSEEALQCALFLAVNYLILGDFKEVEEYINIFKTQINEGCLIKIKSDINRKHISARANYLQKLYPLLLKKESESPSTFITHIGESHCLTFAHQEILIKSEIKIIKPAIINGGKAWHFCNNSNNVFKSSLLKNIEKINDHNQVFISFGEIDCRKEEGILQYSLKYKKDIIEVCQITINGYIDYMEKKLSKICNERYYFGVPAAVLNNKVPDDLDIKRRELIKLYNSYLKKEVLSRNCFFVDVYSLTSDINGDNNGIYMCDKYHLSPQALPILFNNFLYS